MFYAPPHPGPLPPFHGGEGELAVIIAARGVTLTSNFLSGRLETDAIALHGDERRAVNLNPRHLRSDPCFIPLPAGFSRQAFGTPRGGRFR
jgi:hypothetical protein